MTSALSWHGQDVYFSTQKDGMSRQASSKVPQRTVEALAPGAATGEPARVHLAKRLA